MSQKEFVKKTGLPQSTVSYLENGYQALYPKQLELIEGAFPEENMSAYIYESDRYPKSVMRDKTSTADMRTFPGDWSIPAPIKEVDGMGIMCISGRVGVTLDGHLILDRNNGSFEYIGYCTVEPEDLSDNSLMCRMTDKEWFDNEIYEDFKRVYPVACCLAGIVPVKQIRDK